VTSRRPVVTQHDDSSGGGGSDLRCALRESRRTHASRGYPRLPPPPPTSQKRSIEKPPPPFSVAEAFRVCMEAAGVTCGRRSAPILGRLVGQQGASRARSCSSARTSLHVSRAARSARVRLPPLIMRHVRCNKGLKTGMVLRPFKWRRRELNPRPHLVPVESLRA